MGQRMYSVEGQIFIHELTHAWQITYTSFLPFLMCEGLENQVRRAFGGDVYSYRVPQPSFTSDFESGKAGDRVREVH
jgi:hypothetical protein